MIFRVGMKVVCVSSVHDSDDYTYSQGEIVPQVREVYTIRAIIDDNDGAGPGIALEEIVNRPRLYELLDGRAVYDEATFDPIHFRPVKTTSIDVFLKMLEPEKV